MTDDTIIFDRRIAERFGVTEAILINKIWGWVKHNAKNGTNYHDGRYWTFNSAASYAEDLSFISERTIGGVLKKLSEKGFLLIGNYNKTKFDRTSWYSFTDKGFAAMLELGYELNAIQPKELDYEDIANPSADFANGNAESANGKADFADQYQSINTITNTNQEKQSLSFSEKEKDVSSAAEQCVSYNEPTNADKFEEVWLEWCNYAKEQHGLKATVLKHQRQKLLEYSRGNSNLAEKIIDRAIVNSYKNFVPLDEKLTTQETKDTQWE